ncbi:hypothetical protein FACS189468_0060 [Spirochaetia bacterium]|nr:hypothetical protein FACS189468_0060 [Spirochaetia bacterium]
MPEAIDPQEVKRRVAVLKRFRELLTQQRDRFRQYLEVLDKQKEVIEGGSAEDLISHVELEETIVADIFSIQKVIDPLEDMYRASFPPGPVPDGNLPENREVPSLKAVLEDLKTEAVARSERNKELLSKRMAEIRSEIKSLRGNPYIARPSVYAGEGSASLVDIKG